jgi:hypothetical protein
MWRMQMLNLLERLGKFPAEIWLLPPVLILAAMTAAGLVRHRLRLRRYRAIAARTGLAVVPKIINPSELRGRFRGRALVMAICARQRQTFRKRWTRVTVEVVNPEHIGLYIRRQDAFDNLIMSVGGKDVQVGDAEFDRSFVIQSRDERVVAKMFQNAELRHLILQSQIDSAQLLSSKLHAYYAREERDPEHAALLFTAVTSLAVAIDALEANYTPEIIRADRP